MSNRRKSNANLTITDESTSLATLGSFGSASWVAEQFNHQTQQQQTQQNEEEIALLNQQLHVDDLLLLPTLPTPQASNNNSHSPRSHSNSLVMNVQTDESAEYHYECTECSRSFPTPDSLHNHCEQDHRDSNTNSQQSHQYRHDQKQQQQQQQQPRAFKCPHCGKAFTRRSEMGRHVGTQHDNRTKFLHCERCPFKHEDPQQFHKHVADKHKRCKYCRNQFKQLRKHENSCHLKPD